MSKKHTRFREVQGEVALLEQTGEAAAGPRRIRGVGAVADTVNQNSRLYPADVLREAVRMAQAKLTRSLSQGNILGEADHPPYGTRVLETVVKWEAIAFNETTRAVEVEGAIIPTDAGRNVLTLMEAGVFPGLSLRGYGESQYDTEKEIETVTRLELTGFDLVFEPSFEEAGITVLEHKHTQPDKGEGRELEMEPKDEKNGVVDAKLAADLQEQNRRREDAEKALAEAKRAQEAQEAEAKRLAAEKEKLAEANEKLQEAARMRAVADAIAAETAALPYDAALVEKVRESAEVAGLPDAEAVKRFVAAERAKLDAVIEAVKRETAAAAEAKRIEDEKVEAAARVEGRGVRVTGPVIERETGRPEYLEFSEQVREELAIRHLVEREPKRAASPAGELTERMLKAFDKAYRSQLIAEHNERRAWMEASATTDLNLPYSVSRAVIAEAMPQLVAANIFDFGTIDGSPTRVWFKAYAAETGAAPTVTDEVVTSDEGAWVDLAHNYLRPGSVTVTNSAGNVTYTEWSDYRIDYPGGRIYTLASPGTIGDATSLKVDYTYDAMATGEGGAIQRGKTTLSYQDVAVAALRMSVLVNDEAAALGMSQFGWDPMSQAVSSLIAEVNEKIDQAVFYLAINKAIESGNAGGTWTAASDSEGDLVKKMGIAATAVRNDNYAPTAFVMSKTNADRLSNWTGLTREGFPDALLGAAGFEQMMVKGLPVFSSVQMPDSHILVVNRELVQHRVLASRPMSLFGPFQYRDTNGKLTAQKEWYIEQYSGQWSFVANKGGYVKVA
jgi:hypothetical protein